MPGDPASLIDRYLRREAEEGRVTLVGASEAAWDVLVPSYWREAVAVSLVLGERHLRAESFFLRSPEENRGAAFHVLLQRNQRAGPWRFAANEEGDVMLLALVPRAAITEEELDGLLGSFITMADETYRPYMERAFERALKDQVERGGPGLDATPPWARDGWPPDPGADRATRKDAP
jgi:hypothetical protein